MVMKQNPSSSPSVRRSSVRSLALIVASLALASCGGGGGGKDNGGSDDPSVWHFRGVNLVADSPSLQFYVDDTAVATADYGTATDYKPAHTGERPIKVAIRNPSKLETDDPGYTDIGTSETYDFQGPTDYTLIEAGTVADPRQFLITGTSREAVADNIVEYQVINAATGVAGSLDVYITAPGAGIDAPERVGLLALGASSAKTDLTLEVASGAEEDAARSTDLSFEVRSGSTVIYRSNAVSVGEQTRLLVIIGDRAGAPGASPVQAFLISGIAAASATTLVNPTDPSELRAANLSPDAGPIDLIVGTSAMDVFAANVAFGAASPYTPLTAGTYNAIGTPTGNAGSFLFVNQISTGIGRSYTLYGQGPLSGMRGLLFQDDRRVVPTEARFRFLYAGGSEGGKALDVYIVKRGATFDLKATTPPTPKVSSLGYRLLSTQQVLDAGSYDVYLALAGDDEVLTGPLPLDLADGTLQTIAFANAPGGAELEMVHFNDARE